MYAAINAWAFPAEMPASEQIVAAASAGFSGIELVVSVDGSLRFDTPSSECAALKRLAEDLGIQICGLASADFWKINYSSPASKERHGHAS